MNRAQKQALAMALVARVADMVEDWEDAIETDPRKDVLETIDGREAAQQLADWLGRLPGEGWDARLPLPSYSAKG